MNSKIYLFIFITLINFQLSTLVYAEKEDEIQQAIQLVEYVGVDYSSAVSDYKVIDKEEYNEMLEFSQIALDKIEKNLAENKMMINLAISLVEAVNNKQEVDLINVISTDLKRKLTALTTTILLPNSLSNKNEVTNLYKENCSQCHGESGLGDGISAVQLDPKPTNFQDGYRAKNRSIFGLYQAISKGLDGTAMTAYSNLNDQQRWSLAFKIASFSLQDNQISSVDFSAYETKLRFEDIVMFSPNELITNDTSIVMKDLEIIRSNPQTYFFNSKSSLNVTRQLLSQSLSAYKEDNFAKAKTLAVSAYLDGFELIENSIDSHDQQLRKKIEAKLMALRQLLGNSNNLQEVNDAVSESIQLLDQAESLLLESNLSSSTIFTASFIILLREGIEALLVILALFTILNRTEHKRGTKYLHIGWVSALIAGLITWVIAEFLITISGASREIMEGFAALLAAIVLLFVGFWMHNKSKAENWQSYIKQNINKKLKSGSLWGIAGLSFIAVYREVFETILFYQSLIIQTQPNQQLSILLGFVTGLVILALISWLVIKYSIKIPIAKFFTITSYVILILAFILMGKAVSALQEAALITSTPFPINISIEWLGVYSTWQGLSSQALILSISTIMLYSQWKSKII